MSDGPDLQTERLNKLEETLSRMNDRIEEALAAKTPSGQEQASREIQRVQDEFTPEEKRMVREHREWSAFERNMDRYEKQRAERKAAKKASKVAANGDDPADDPEAPADEPDEHEAAAKPGKKRPPGRHPKPKKPKTPAKQPHWLLRD